MNSKKSSTNLKKLLTVSRSSDVENTGPLLCKLYLSIKLDHLTTADFDDLSALAQLVASENATLITLITRDWESIMVKLFESARYGDDFLDIQELFVKYKFNYHEFIRYNGREVQSAVDALWAKAFFKIGLADFDQSYAEYINDQLGLESLDSSPFFTDHCYYISQSREYPRH